MKGRAAGAAPAARAPLASLNVLVAAERLGVCRRSVYNWVAYGWLEPVRSAKGLRVSAASVEGMQRRLRQQRNLTGELSQRARRMREILGR